MREESFEMTLDLYITSEWCNVYVITPKEFITNTPPLLTISSLTWKYLQCSEAMDGPSNM